jgi:hypothetical protein
VCFVNCFTNLLQWLSVHDDIDGPNSDTDFGISDYLRYPENSDHGRDFSFESCRQMNILNKNEVLPIRRGCQSSDWKFYRICTLSTVYEGLMDSNCCLSLPIIYPGNSGEISTLQTVAYHDAISEIYVKYMIKLLCACHSVTLSESIHSSTLSL